jgi:hypothetical protein
MLPSDHRHEAEQNAVDRSDDRHDEAADFVVLHELRLGKASVHVQLTGTRRRYGGARRPQQKHDGV